MARRKHRPIGGEIVQDLPGPLVAMLSEQLGAELPLFLAAQRDTPPISIRVNPEKGFDPDIDRVKWCSTGRYLDERPAFTFDPLLHAGAYYVQEASSMFLEQALQASGMLEQDILALDLCAAPGGKSTHLRSLLTRGSLLVANEIDGKRQHIIQENLWKWGDPNVIVTGSASKDLIGLPAQFDLILLDAPCSGEGMFRKDPFAREQWTPRLVAQCAMVQREIVQHAWHALAPGGILIYSTCTWETVENEAQLRPLVEQGALPIEIPLQNEWNIERSELDGVIGYRFYPHRLRGEGFFMGLLKKPGELEPRKAAPGAQSDQLSFPFVKHHGTTFFTEMNGVQHALDDTWGRATQQLRGVLRTLAPGIPVAEKKGAEWKPHAAIALNQLLDTTELNVIDLSLAQAITYLQGHALPMAGAHGTALATFAGRPMGWLQGAGNRWNNRWPAPWRIRSHNAQASPVTWADHRST